MKMKRILAMPIMCLVVAMLGVAVMAASPSQSFKVHKDVTDEDKSQYFHGTSISSTTFKVTDIPGIDSALSAKDKDLKASDFSYLVGWDVEPNDPADKLLDKPYRVFITADIGANDYAIVVHLHDDGTLDTYEIIKGATSEVSIGGINDFSPFLVFKATVKASAQTGEYAAPYIIMISVALVSCGAIFAIRAKKATK
jgi:hypothetical protein